MKTLKLSARLAAIASFVRHGDKIIDVGSDHGYLPVWLLINGITSFAVATDISEKPLKKAFKCAQEHGALDRMEFIRTDGLSGIGLDNVDTVVVAGMGGESIAEIIKNAPGLMEGSKRLILQPMSKAGELVKALYSSGFHVEDEKLAKDSGEIYRVILARFGQDAKPPEGAGMLVGEPLFSNRDPLLPEYLKRLCGKMTHAKNGMLCASSGKVREKADELGRLIVELEMMKGRCQ